MTKKTGWPASAVLFVPLQDFLLFKQVVDKIQNKEHLTRKGLEEIVAIKASINNGLPEELKTAFPNTSPKGRPEITLKENPDPNWVAGFAEGECCFYVKLRKSSSYRVGYRVELLFQITQHFRDKQLMESLVKYFVCGRIEIDKRGPAVNYRLIGFKNMDSTIIPFFDKYLLQGSKLLDYRAFCEVASLMKNKSHLTSEGLMKIQAIKSSMNSKRELI